MSAALSPERTIPPMIRRALAAHEAERAGIEAEATRRRADDQEQHRRARLAERADFVRGLATVYGIDLKRPDPNGRMTDRSLVALEGDLIAEGVAIDRAARIPNEYDRDAWQCDAEGIRFEHCDDHSAYAWYICPATGQIECERIRRLADLGRVIDARAAALAAS